MNKFLAITAFLIVFAMVSCKNPGGSPVTLNEEKQFYPIGGYIESQLNYLDSVPLAIIHYTTLNNSTDTGIIEKSKFRETIGKEFIQSDISGEQYKKSYTETSFIDATLSTITLNYVPEKQYSNLPVRKIDILFKQENADVNTVYVEKIINVGDSVVLKKMLWTANKSCQVTSIIQKNNGQDQIVQERFVWDE